jgi:hypothetical protein
MKILLVEDFSNYHVFLMKGLRSLGHEIDLYSQGDHHKETETTIKRDRKISYFAVFDFFKSIKLFKSYDIVQFIGVPALRNNILLWLWMLFCSKKLKHKFFFCAVGCDYIFWTKGRAKLNIPLFEECQRYDHLYYSRRTTFKARLCSYIMLKACHGVIGVNEYYEAYKDEKTQLTAIPQPIDLKHYLFVKRDFNKKLVVFHGIHYKREGFKGTPHIKAAFEILNKKYANDVVCICKGDMSYSEYLSLIEDVDVILDQTNFVSYGMTALAGMAMGKIVASCSQNSNWLEQWLPKMGITEFPPILPLLPDKDQIVSQVEWILTNRHLLPEMSLKGRNFVDKYHDAEVIASEFIKAWRTH